MRYKTNTHNFNCRNVRRKKFAGRGCEVVATFPSIKEIFNRSRRLPI
ncbi:MAG: hypothetical protein IKO74_05110 [Selenomonadaceae bacterium]|nr:hypothetical protein [Selenomonadaceae bacterium]